MPANLLQLHRYVRSQIRELSEDRIADGISKEYLTAREAMIHLHCEWQDLMIAVKINEIDKHAALAALRLAAAAIKFASDLGDPTLMGLDKQKR